MCCICTFFGWTLDFVQRCITYVLACYLGVVVCVGMLVAVSAGVAYGYNYSLAEYISLKRELPVSIYQRSKNEYGGLTPMRRRFDEVSVSAIPFTITAKTKMIVQLTYTAAGPTTEHFKPTTTHFNLASPPRTKTSTEPSEHRTSSSTRRRKGRKSRKRLKAEPWYKNLPEGAPKVWSYPKSKIFKKQGKLTITPNLENGGTSNPSSETQAYTEPKTVYIKRSSIELKIPTRTSYLDKSSQKYIPTAQHSYLTLYPKSTGIPTPLYKSYTYLEPENAQGSPVEPTISTATSYLEKSSQKYIPTAQHSYLTLYPKSTGSPVPLGKFRVLPELRSINGSSAKPFKPTRCTMYNNSTKDIQPNTEEDAFHIKKYHPVDIFSGTLVPILPLSTSTNLRIVDILQKLEDLYEEQDTEMTQETTIVTRYKYVPIGPVELDHDHDYSYAKPV